MRCMFFVNLRHSAIFVGYVSCARGTDVRASRARQLSLTTLQAPPPTMAKSKTPANEIDDVYVNKHGRFILSPIEDWTKRKEIDDDIREVHDGIEGILSDISGSPTHWKLLDLESWYRDIRRTLASRSWTILYRAAELTSD